LVIVFLWIFKATFTTLKCDDVALVFVLMGRPTPQSITVESRYNKHPYNKDANIMKDILQPNNSEMYGKEPQLL